MHRNGFQKYIEGKIEGRIEVTGRRGRIRKRLLDLQEEGECWKLKEETLDRNTGELASEEAVDLSSVCLLNELEQCFLNFVRPRPGKFIFIKTSARSQLIYS